MAGFTANDPVAKGAVTLCLDEMSTAGNAGEQLAGLRDALKAIAPTYAGLAAVLAQRLLPQHFASTDIPAIQAHLAQYWFNEQTGWWPLFQPVAPIYGAGLLQTLNLSLAGKTPLPIDSYWVLNHQNVEMINLVSARQVTLIIATPPPPGTPPGIQGEASEVWVSARRAGVTALEVDPATLATGSGGPESRVRTYRVQPAPPPRKS